ncbi:MAG: phosphoribosyltransferase family protein [Actinomycetota bacterium]
MTDSPTVDVLGTIWHADRTERTPLGRLVEAAKDRDDDAAVALLAAEMQAWVATGGVAVDPTAIVVGIPASPDRPNRLVPAVARALAGAAGAAYDDAVVRHTATVRLRELPPEARPTMVAAADYEVVGGVDGRAVVLVDDVVLSGATLGHVAELLRDAGAGSVHLVALARSRRG